MTEVKLHHAPQQNPWGCLWHAMYAVTGDAAFLRPEYSTEVHWLRVDIIAFSLGWLATPIFTDNALGHAARVSPGFWSKMQRLACAHTSGLLVVVGYEMPGGLGHAVGVAFQTDGQVSISDSLYLEIITVNMQAFLKTDYAARACIVQQVLEARLDAYPMLDARTALHDQIRSSRAQETPYGDPR